MNSMEAIQQEVDKFIRFVKKQDIGFEVGKWPDEKVKQLCIKLIKDEHKELQDAIELDDWTEIIDGAADLIYVVLYAMSKGGVRLADFWEEVCITNIRKEGGPIDKETGKQLKPADWKPPRIKELLHLHRMRHSLLSRIAQQHVDAVMRGRVHRLKTWRPAFEEILLGNKRYEWRQGGNYMIGDYLLLQEYGGKTGRCFACNGGGVVPSQADMDGTRCIECMGTGDPSFSGRELLCAVTHVTSEAQMLKYFPPTRLSPETNWIVMGIKPLFELGLDLPEPRELLDAQEYLGKKYHTEGISW